MVKMAAHADSSSKLNDVELADCVVCSPGALLGPVPGGPGAIEVPVPGGPGAIEVPVPGGPGAIVVSAPGGPAAIEVPVPGDPGAIVVSVPDPPDPSVDIAGPCGSVLTSVGISVSVVN